MNCCKTRNVGLMFSFLVLASFHFMAMWKGAEAAEKKEMQLVGELYKGPLKVGEFLAPVMESGQFMLATNQLLIPEPPKSVPGSSGSAATPRDKPRQLKVAYEVTSLDKITSTFGLRVILSETDTETTMKDGGRDDAGGAAGNYAELTTRLDLFGKRTWIFPLGACSDSTEQSPGCYSLKIHISGFRRSYRIISASAQ